jgi:hypothetical protein
VPISHPRVGVVWFLAPSLLALPIALSLTAAAVRIAGSSTCPTPQEVEAELGRFPGAPPGGVQAVVLDLITDDSKKTLRVQLYDADGIFQGERLLPSDQDCQALAMAVATLLRSLALELGEILPTTPLVSPPARVLARHDSSLSFEVGGAIVRLVDTSGDETIGALAVASLGIGDFPVRPAFTLESDLRRGVAVTASGLGTWWRVWGAPGAEWRLHEGRLFLLSLHAEVPLGLVVANGSNFPINGVGAAPDIGLDLGVRAGIRVAKGSKLRLWLDLRGTSWPVSHILSVSGNPKQVTLPQWEGSLGLGLSWVER